MHSHRLVLPSDLNQYGYLYGGRLLAWIDEAAWIAASLAYPHCQFVTVGMSEVAFHHSVRQGTILGIDCQLVREGETSVTYRVVVVDERDDPAPKFSTEISFVSVDDEGRKRAIRAIG